MGTPWLSSVKSGVVAVLGWQPATLENVTRVENFDPANVHCVEVFVSLRSPYVFQNKPHNVESDNSPR